jgi:hypothetical protein
MYISDSEKMDRMIKELDLITDKRESKRCTLANGKSRCSNLEPERISSAIIILKYPISIR